MSFRLLVVDTYYTQFLDTFYSQYPQWRSWSYQKHRDELLFQSFGTADYYSKGLCAHGVDAEEVIANCSPLQSAWAREKAPNLFRARQMARVPKLRRRWFEEVLRSQIADLNPQVIYFQNVSWPSEAFLRWLRGRDNLVVGQHGTALSKSLKLGFFDLIISCIPKVVRYVRAQGVASEFLALGFGSGVLDRVQPMRERFDSVHVGGYGPIHEERNAFLEEVAFATSCDFWGYGEEHLRSDSPIRERFRGEAWGLDMYRIRSSARFTLTKHISSVAGSDVGNSTMYETTGVGGCLVVDAKDNLASLFEPDIEVVAYSSAPDAVEKIRFLSADESARSAIAQAGQRRTLRDHTYDVRMEELADLLKGHM